MPARDTYHDLVVRALEHDGWAITADPLRLTYGQRDFYVDLAAEHVTVAAERGHRKIAVEIKSLGDRSPMRAFEHAVGQFVVYRMVLQEHEPEQQLCLGGCFRGVGLLFSFSEALQIAPCRTLG